jgi:hypothetical protein
MQESDFGQSEDEHFRYRECYVFNINLGLSLDDARCSHCRKYLTLDCKYINEFVDGDEGVE